MQDPQGHGERRSPGKQQEEQSENDAPNDFNDGDELRADLDVRVEKLKARADVVIGTKLDNKIEVICLLGKGGMSSVYKAHHKLLDQIVAVKIMHPSFACDTQAVLRFQREAKAAFAFQHENLVSVHDIGTTPDGLPYFVMDYIEGDSLAEEVERGPIELTRAMEIFRQVCAGLKAAHNKNIVHRDIKPSNILLYTMPDGTEKAKIADFGIAKVLTEDTNQIQKLTQTGEIFGSPLYMSPEQCMGNPTDRRSDIYAFGCVMYECLSGEVPLAGSTPFDTLSKHVNVLPKRLTEFPDTVNNAILCCLEKRPQDRYQTVEELESDLFGDQIKRRAKQRIVKEITPRQKWFRLIGVATAMFVLIFCVTFVVAFWTRITPFFAAFGPETEWRSLTSQAHTQQNFGPANFEAARSLYLKAIDSAVKDKAPPLEIERIYGDLGRLCNQSKDWNGGIKYFGKALELGKSHLPDPEVAAYHDWLGDAYKWKGQYKEAIEHGKIAVDLKKQLLGAEHQYTLFALLHLGQAYRLNKNLLEAESTDREAVKVAEALYPKHDTPYVADAYLQLGAVLNDLGKWDEAIDNFKKAFVDSKAIRGRDHELTSEIVYKLLAVANAHGRGDEAQKFIDEGKE
jgi:Serine/threonine protein kinase